MHKLILIFVLIVINSCSNNDKDQYTDNQNLYYNNTLKDNELYSLAKENISNNQFDLALSQLNKIQVLFPSSPYTSKSMLFSAYIHFILKDYEKARAIAENYKKYYPGSDDIVYANYLDAMTYFVTIKKTNYSQKNAEISLDKFTFILNAYPNSKYEIDIITKINLINSNLALAKINTAKFYLERDNYNGSLIYLLDIFNNHSSSSSIEETLFYLSKIYYEIGEYELAKKYASILAYNFSNSEWYEKSYKIISGIEDISEEEKWFDKYNPVKIFMEDNEKNLNENEILPLE